MILVQALIALFFQALNEKWGYIWGTAGVMWTAAKQKQKVDYMISKYGENWQKNADAKNDNYYSAALYGSKWIDHMVADCSGLFAWAFKKLGGSIYHGSNSIYDRYCTTKGKITDDIRKTMIPGTAVFVDKNGNKSHIGLYVGNGKVIEASGTQAGVCTSNLTAGKWTYYGLLKNVDYSENPAIPAPSEPVDDNSPVDDYPTLKKGNKGDWVTVLQNKLLIRGYALPRYGADGDFGSETEKAVKQFQKDNGLKADGIVGAKTWAALNADSPVYYTVTIPHQLKAAADEIISKYGGTMTAEKG